MKNNIKNRDSNLVTRNSMPRVFVGLSGGVDSAVSAALLKKQGYDVTGVFIKAWTPFDDAQGKPKYPCTWREDRRSAMRVAAILDIPFLTLDLEKEYKKEVVDYMIAEYKKGRTPNPDVMCNKEIKFGHFLKFALKNGADFVATGHYARNELRKTSYEEPKKKNIVSRASYFVLREGVDPNKDQSYFLWTLTQEQLKHILFPIGHLQKSEVRKLAGKFGLPQETRKDSQGLCFLGKIDMKEFLKEYIGSQKGKVLLENGEIIGEHDGAILYTIGERHGFSVNNRGTKSEPLYVVSKNLEKNTITVASSQQLVARKDKKKIEIQNINIISEIPNNKLSCRIRYRGEKIPCQITPQKPNQQGSSLLVVEFDKPQSGIASGQSLVLYDARPNGSSGQGEICLGGGIIV